MAVARIVGGIMGASITTASAYIADIRPPERRAQNFGLIGVAFGIGFVAGPFLGGVLGEFGSRVPFYAAAIASADGRCLRLVRPAGIARRRRTASVSG